MDDLTGRTLGPYQIVAPLGEGGMAAVYKAYQPSVERYVAVKVLPRKFAEDAQFVARFKREAKLVASLQHPHILQVFDFGEVDGYSYLVMPLVSGGTLEEEMRRGALTIMRVRDVMRQLCGALAHAHESGMVHRDMKPSNVLVDKAGNCLLSDFGLARMADSSVFLTNAGTLLGTPVYMSPEQCRGGELDGRSDLYGLGIMLFEMLAGRPPYAADTPLATLYKHVHDPIPRLREANPGASEALERIIQKALAKDPDERYASAAAFGSALDAALAMETRPAAPAPPGPVEGHARPNRTPAPGRDVISRRMLLSGAAGLGALGAAAGAVWVFSSAGTPSGPAPAATLAGTGGGPGPSATAADASPAAPPAALIKALPSTALRQLSATLVELTLAAGVTLQFVRVSAGEFLMGSAPSDPKADEIEKPQHRLTLPEFWMGKTAVTIGQFGVFAAAANHASEASVDPGDKANHPVVDVTQADCVAFCTWASALSRVKIQLPSEAEWEKAARGPDGRLYPWGNEPPDATRCNFDNTAQGTTPAGKYGSRGASPYGCDDMAGNVWTWTRSLWGSDFDNQEYGYPYTTRQPERENEQAEVDVLRVLRGGAYSDNADVVRSAHRFRYNPDYYFDGLGFRVVLARLPAG